MKRKDVFHILAPFSIKAPTTPQHDPAACDTEDNEVIKISGYANFSGLVEDGDVFIDLVGDVVVPSGIDVAVWKKNPQMLLHHQRDNTIGRGLSCVKKKDGLFIEAEIHRGAMEDEDFYRIKSGLLCYFSIGFRTLSSEMKKVGDKNVYFITKSLLLEVSVVGIPCNGESSFQIIKSLPDNSGFYSGDLSGKIFSDPIENESQHQGDSRMTVTMRELMTPAQVKEYEAKGLTSLLDAEKVLSFTELKDLIKAEIKHELSIEAATAEALAAEQKAAEQKAAEEAAAAEALDAEQKAAEVAELEAGIQKLLADINTLTKAI